MMHIVNWVVLMRDISHVFPGSSSWQEFQYMVGVSYHLEDLKLNCWEDYEEIRLESGEFYEAIFYCARIAICYDASYLVDDNPLQTNGKPLLHLLQKAYGSYCS
ncbi:hypothetical protein DUI87_15893 [Hirundo rustica rustica]|uniref:Uncharacterized protein n=1 Tax=Hirundo rustica rustica TaxID=333673 RepID=A0A3M0K0H2_HIRRU|nr:hypothetical protein DUI87_15893 [Hirundo rustica rustica]